MDFLDFLAPIYSGGMDCIPPPIGSGHIGRTLPLNRTEEVRGSNPLRSTHEPPYVGVIVLFDPTGGGIILVQQIDDSNRVQPGATGGN